jgi:SMODS and SLOG-associating 2TM effector domain 1
MSEPAAQLPLFHVVGFSGHRQVRDAAAVTEAIRETLTALRREGPGEWIGLSSVAVGSDTVFVREALRSGVAWHAILPLPPSDFRQDFSVEEWRDVEALLSEAEQVRVISENGTREDAYLDCGMETVNGCDVLLAVWDGEPPRGRGGTAEVVAYARELGKPIVLINAVTFEVQRERFERFIAHDHQLRFFNALPDAPGRDESNVFHALAPIFRFQQKVDFAASRGAPQFRRMIAGTVLLHVLATLVAAAGLAFGWHNLALPWIKLLCLLAALGVALMLRYANAHHNWVRCRLAAEIARSALATWGLPRAAPLFEDLDLVEFRPLMRSLHILHRRAATAQPMPLPEFKELYLKKRVEDQLSYYQHRLARALPQLVRLRTGFWGATLLAILCTAAYAVHETFHWGPLPMKAETMLYYFLPISLPIIAAAFISLISVHDLHRRVARYREMEHSLKGARSQIAFCQTWNSLERLVQKTEHALLQEVLEWHSITSFAESH